jgi:hypothetical protein
MQLHQKKEASNYVERFRPTIESLAIEIQKTGWADEQITRTNHIFLFYPGLRYGFDLSERDKQRQPGEYVIYSDGIAIFALGPGRYPIRMVCGIQANLYEDGVLEFAGGYDFLAPYLPSSIPDLRWIGVGHAPSGSVLLERHFRGLRDGIIKSLRPALEHFARMIEASI